MRFNFRQKLFKGASINFSKALNFKTKRERKPTQAELAKMEKATFLAVNMRRFTEICSEYLASKGFLCDEDGVALFHIEEEPDWYKDFDNIRTLTIEALRNASDGGVLTSKRRDTILNGIYAVENLLQRNTDKSHMYAAMMRRKVMKKEIKRIQLYTIIACATIYLSPLAIPLLMWRHKKVMEIREIESIMGV